MFLFSVMLVAIKDGPINVRLQFKNESIKGNENCSYALQNPNG